jgi:hypothetical protein
VSIPPNNGNEKEPEKSRQTDFLASASKKLVMQSSPSKGGDFSLVA